jgi:muramoyltetrapeptide carboxypeptidase
MITPPYLKRGDNIAIVATAKNIVKDDLDYAIKVLNKWGLKVFLGKNINSIVTTDKLKDIQDAINDNSIKAIFCARGGYGTIKIIDDINFDNLIENPKWLIGFSDITILHSQLHNKGIESVHAIMPLHYKKKSYKESLKTLQDVLFGNNIQYNIDNHAFNKMGVTNGQLVGGNLYTLCTMIGTPSDIDTNGKILFIEDIGEPLHKVDGLLHHLKRSGKLNNLNGLIVGHFTNVEDGNQHEVYNIISELVKEFDYPVCYNFPVGHEPHNYALICGRYITLSINTNVTLTF